ncbi:MAG: baseplate J/gp47 family protein [Chloroflexi bacterium]|nr:baseplate J/gp47 family protein [Chloroflexota bacterium]
MAAIVYLDIDDEITSAAARIRSLTDERIGLVLPAGSRLSTSRINFRLLAREAATHGKQVDVITNDASARALAASAGLPTHESVAAFEAGPQPAAARAGAGGAAVATGGVAADPGPGRPADDSPTVVVPAVPTLTKPAERSPVPQVGRPPARRRWPVVAAVLVLIAVLATSGTAAFLLLPSAQITLVPATDQVGPIELNVTAQAGVTAPDPVNLLVPAVRFPFTVTATDTFPATGVKVTETGATGEVTFSSLNTGGSNTIRQGAIVQTESGIQFRTLADVELPPAEIGIAGDPPAFVVIPSTRKVGVEAVAPGPSGNVAAGTIVVVPENENPLRTKVSNQDPTTGGSRTESPQVQQSDVDAALRTLDASLATAFDEQIAGATGVPDGTTLFPATKALGAATPTIDPATLVGTEAAEFELGVSAEGTVIGVDPGPVSTLAEARLRAAVDDGFALDEATINVQVGDPIVAGSIITFPVTVRALEIRELDPAELLAKVRGLGLPQARTVLGAYGAVRITVWPDWVTAIPTREDRATLTIEAASPEASPGTSGEPSRSDAPSPTTSPGTSPGTGPAASPAP